MFFFPRWPVVHVHQNWYYRSKVVNNIKSSIGHLNHQESSFFALYSILSMFCRFCCCNHVYKYQPKKFGWCTLNNMIHSDCLVFCMRPRLYFRLLHLNTEKLSNIHYNFFFSHPYAISVLSICLFRILIVVMFSCMLWVDEWFGSPYVHIQVQLWRRNGAHIAHVPLKLSVGALQ